MSRPCLHQRHQPSADQVEGVAARVGFVLQEWQRAWLAWHLPRHPAILTCLEPAGHAGDHRNIDGETWPA